MKVLVACEFSGTVRDAFSLRGHDAWSCDLLPTERPGPHIQGDALEAIYSQPWDLLIAHPPCTYLSNSGVRHLYDSVTSRLGTRAKVHGAARWAAMREGAAFFKAMLDAPIARICVENPVPHRYALEIIGRKYSQRIDPFKFGHPESKATCLWLKGLPPLRGTHDVKAIMQTLPKNQQQRLHYLPPSADRGKLRSVTFSGVAEAMANQWAANTECAFK